MHGEYTILQAAEERRRNWFLTLTGTLVPSRIVIHVSSKCNYTNLWRILRSAPRQVHNPHISTSVAKKAVPHWWTWLCSLIHAAKRSCSVVSSHISSLQPRLHNETNVLTPQTHELLLKIGCNSGQTLNSPQLWGAGISEAPLSRLTCPISLSHRLAASWLREQSWDLQDIKKNRRGKKMLDTAVSFRIYFKIQGLIGSCT